jgi:hypothetical protein
LMSGSAIGWTNTPSLSWESIFVVFIAFFNESVIKISILVFSQISVSILVFIMLIFYFCLYIYSFRVIVRKIPHCICSIAEK